MFGTVVDSVQHILYKHLPLLVIVFAGMQTEGEGEETVIEDYFNEEHTEKEQADHHDQLLDQLEEGYF